MKRWIVSMTFLTFGLATATALAQDKPIPGIRGTSEVVKLHSGFTFTEGPAADAEGNVYFTDIPNNRIHKVDTDGKLTTFLEDSKACNGLMFDSKGRLIACQGGAGKVIAIDMKTKAITPLAEQYDGKRFNAPNDLVVDWEDGVYFTDPSFGNQGKSQDKVAVYYVSNQGKTTRIIDDVALPNGVILSPDEKTLYVLPSGSPDVMAYPVEAPGKIGKGRVLCKLEQAPTGAPRGGDGMTIDTKGNLYLTAPHLKAIQVVSPEGKTLGLITFPEAPANCSFGGKDMKTLFATARTSLYTVKLDSTGHRFATGKK